MRAVRRPKVGNDPRVEAAVDLLAAEYAGHRLLARRGVDQRFQAAHDSVADLVVLATGSDASLGLTSEEVDVDAPQAHGVGLGARPVDVLEEFSELAPVEQILQAL